MKPLAPDTLLQGRYQVKKMIGTGGMGEVYLATDTRLGNQVALKRTTVGDDEILAAAFEREARTLAGLRHPVLPKVSDHFLEKDEQFLIMDFIEGEDLSSRLKESSKPFPVKWVLFWADQLLEALTYLHTQDPPIIHRDIKPQNLKLTAENQIVLLDFGLSKHAIGETRVTTSGSVVGYTPHYAPMEQIRGTGTNETSDIYSLSATLYQLLTNTVPPDAITRAENLLSNNPDPLRPPDELNGALPESISHAIIHGLEISQENRYASAREMQKKLRSDYTSIHESATAETEVFNIGEYGDDVPATPDARTEVNVGVPSDTIPNAPPDKGAQTDTAAGLPPGEEEIAGDKTEAFDAEVLGTVPGALDPSGIEKDVGSDVSQDSDESTSGAEELTVAANVPLHIPIEEPVPADDDQAPREGSEHTASHGAPPPPKSGRSIGKIIGAIVGVTALLLVVVVSGAAGLWYFTRDTGDAGNPTPEPASSVEATPEETVTPTPEETNTAETPANSGPIIAVPSPSVKSTPLRTPSRTPVVRKTPVKKAPVKTPVKPKKTPRKKKDPGVL